MPCRTSSPTAVIAFVIGVGRVDFPFFSASAVTAAHSVSHARFNAEPEASTAASRASFAVSYTLPQPPSPSRPLFKTEGLVASIVPLFSTGCKVVCVRVAVFIRLHNLRVFRKLEHSARNGVFNRNSWTIGVKKCLEKLLGLQSLFVPFLV